MAAAAAAAAAAARRAAAGEEGDVGSEVSVPREAAAAPAPTTQDDSGSPPPVLAHAKSMPAKGKGKGKFGKKGAVTIGNLQDLQQAQEDQQQQQPPASPAESPMSEIPPSAPASPASSAGKAKGKGKLKSKSAVNLSEAASSCPDSPVSAQSELPSPKSSPAVIKVTPPTESQPAESQPQQSEQQQQQPTSSQPPAPPPSPPPTPKPSASSDFLHVPSTPAGAQSQTSSRASQNGGAHKSKTGRSSQTPLQQLEMIKQEMKKEKEQQEQQQQQGQQQQKQDSQPSSSKVAPPLPPPSPTTSEAPVTGPQVKNGELLACIRRTLDGIVDAVVATQVCRGFINDLLPVLERPDATVLIRTRINKQYLEELVQRVSNDVQQGVSPDHPFEEDRLGDVESDAAIVEAQLVSALSGPEPGAVLCSCHGGSSFVVAQHENLWLVFRPQCSGVYAAVYLFRDSSDAAECIVSDCGVDGVWAVIRLKPLSSEGSPTPLPSPAPKQSGGGAREAHMNGMKRAGAQIWGEGKKGKSNSSNSPSSPKQHRHHHHQQQQQQQQQQNPHGSGSSLATSTSSTTSSSSTSSSSRSGSRKLRRRRRGWWASCARCLCGSNRDDDEERELLHELHENIREAEDGHRRQLALQTEQLRKAIEDSVLSVRRDLQRSIEESDQSNQAFKKEVRGLERSLSTQHSIIQRLHEDQLLLKPFVGGVESTLAKVLEQVKNGNSGSKTAAPANPQGLGELEGSIQKLLKAMQAETKKASAQVDPGDPSVGQDERLKKAVEQVLEAAIKEQVGEITDGFREHFKSHRKEQKAALEKVVEKVKKYVQESQHLIQESNAHLQESMDLQRSRSKSPSHQHHHESSSKSPKSPRTPEHSSHRLLREHEELLQQQQAQLKQLQQLFYMQYKQHEQQQQQQQQQQQKHWQTPGLRVDSTPEVTGPEAPPNLFWPSAEPVVGGERYSPGYNTLNWDEQFGTSPNKQSRSFSGSPSPTRFGLAGDRSSSKKASRKSNKKGSRSNEDLRNERPPPPWDMDSDWASDRLQRGRGRSPRVDGPSDLEMFG